MEITFSRATLAYQATIFSWLDEPHVKEFWDNSPAHREDIIHFMKGRETPSDYFNGIFSYWLGFIDTTPYAFLLTSPYTEDQQMTALHREHLSRTGKTYSIDFCIGNSAYLGKGLASTTLELFVAFFQEAVDPLANTFFIDPSENNPRALHVYEKAGFKTVGTFPVTEGFFSGDHSLLMVKKAL